MSFLSPSPVWRFGGAVTLGLALLIAPWGAVDAADETLQLSDFVIARLSRHSRARLLDIVQRGLEHRDGTLRSAALEAARAFRTRELAPTLNELALSSDDPESLAALDALATGSDASAVAVARERLNAPSAELRKAALGVLAALPPSTFRIAEPLVFVLLRDNEPRVREKAVWTIGHIGSTGGIQALNPLLKDPDAEVRRATVQALGALGGDVALRSILASVDDPNSNVANMALLVLSRSELRTQSDVQREARARILALLSESRQELAKAGLEVLLETTPDPAHAKALRAMNLEPSSTERAWLKNLLGAPSLVELRTWTQSCVQTGEAVECVPILRDLGPSTDPWLIRLAREGRISRTALVAGAGLEGRPLLIEFSLELVTSKQPEVKRAALIALQSSRHLGPEALLPLLVALAQPETSKDDRHLVVKLIGRTRGAEARGWLASLRSTVDPTLGEVAELAWIEHALRYSEDFDDIHVCEVFTRRSGLFKQIDVGALSANRAHWNRVAACFVSHAAELTDAARASFRRFLLDVALTDAGAIHIEEDRNLPLELSLGLAKLVEASVGPEKVELVQLAVRLGLSKSLLASLRVPAHLEPEHWRTLALGIDGALPAPQDPWLAVLSLSQLVHHHPKQVVSNTIARVPSGAQTLGARLVLLQHASGKGQSPEDLSALGKTACRWLESAEVVDNILGAETLGHLGTASSCADRLGQLATLAPSRWVRKKSLNAIARLRTTLLGASRLLAVCRIYEPDDWVREACQEGTTSLAPEQATPNLRRIVVRDERGRPLPLVPFLSFPRRDGLVPSLFVSTSQGTALVPKSHETWLPLD